MELDDFVSGLPIQLFLDTLNNDVIEGIIQEIQCQTCIILLPNDELMYLPLNDIPTFIKRIEILDVTDADMDIDADKTLEPKKALETQNVVFGNQVEDLAVLRDRPDEQYRYSMEVQMTDLLENMLTKMSFLQRTNAKMNQLHRIISRFEELYLQNFHKINETNKHKPLLKYFQSLSQSLYWIVPVVKNKTKLYYDPVDNNEGEKENLVNGNKNLDEDLEDVTNPTSVRIPDRTFLQAYTDIFDEYKNHNNGEQLNRYNTLYKELYPWLTPFEDADLEENATDNVYVIGERQTNANLQVVVNNLGNMETDGLTNTMKFMMERYITGLTHLVLNPDSNETTVELLTPNDKLCISSFLMLPEPVIQFSNINLPETSILDRVIYNQHFLQYWQLFTGATQIKHFKNKTNSLKHTQLIYSNKIMQIKPSIKNRTLLNYSTYMEDILPSSNEFYQMLRVRNTFRHCLTINDILYKMQPFLLFKNTLMCSLYQKIIGLIHYNKLKLSQESYAQKNELNKYFAKLLLMKHRSIPQSHLLLPMQYKKDIDNAYQLLPECSPVEIYAKALHTDNLSLLTNTIAYAITQHLQIEPLSKDNLEMFIKMQKGNAKVKQTKDSTCSSIKDMNDCLLEDTCTVNANKCVNLETNKAELQESFLQEMAELYHARLNNRLATILREYQHSLLFLPLLKQIQYYNLTKYAYIQYQLGQTVQEQTHIVSPFQQVLDLILMEENFTLQQSYIVKFVNMFTRNALQAPNFNKDVDNVDKNNLDKNVDDVDKDVEDALDKDLENAHWLYCVKTNQPLLPVFKSTLASTFVNNNTDYTNALEEIKATIGIKYEGNWYDKYTHWLIAKGEFDTNEGYNEEGFKNVSRELLVMDIDNDLTDFDIMDSDSDSDSDADADSDSDADSEVEYGDKKTEKRVKKEKKKETREKSKEKKETKEEEKRKQRKTKNQPDIEKIVNHFSKKLGISLESQMSFIITQAEVLLAKHSQNATKDKDKDSNNSHFKNVLIITISLIVLVLQMAIPPLHPKKTSVCKDKGSADSVEYISCLTKHLYGTFLKDKTEQDIAAQINKIVNYFKKDKHIQEQLLKKDKFMETYVAPNATLVANMNVWTHFLPPLVPFTLSLKTLESPFRSQLTHNIDVNSSKQFDNINTIEGKIIQYSLGVQEEIRKSINTQPPILHTYNQIPFVENTCCQSLPNLSVIDYFMETNPLVKTYNKYVEFLSMYLHNIQAKRVPNLFGSEMNTQSKYPVLSLNHIFVNNRFLAFIHYCKYRYGQQQMGDDIVPLYLQPCCPPKPHISLSNSKSTFLETFVKQNQNDPLFNEHALQHLLKTISKHNIQPSAFELEEQPNPMLDLLKQKMDEKEIVAKEVEKVEVDFEEEKSKQSKQRENKKKAKEKEKAKEKVKESIKTQKNKNVDLDVDLDLDQELCKLLLKIYQNEEKEEELEGQMENIQNFLLTKIDDFKESIQSFFDRNEPKTTKQNKQLVKQRNLFLTNYNEWLDMKPQNLQNIVQFYFTFATYFANIFPNIITHQVNLTTMSVPSYHLFSQNHKQKLRNIHKEYNNLIPLFGVNPELQALFEQTQAKMAFLLKIMNYARYFSANENQERIDTVFYLFEYTLLYCLHIYVECANQMDDKTVNQLTVQMLSLYMQTYNTQKALINISYETIQDRVFKIKEREKNRIVESKEAMTDNARHVDKQLKQLKLGTYAKGLESGLRKLNKAAYDSEIGLRQDLAFTEQQLTSNGDTNDADDANFEVEDNDEDEAGDYEENNDGNFDEDF